MKKIILPFLGLFCICLSATAQFKSGDVLLGGNLSFGTFNSTPTVNTNNTKSTNIYVNPTIGFFTSDKTIYSVGLIYGHNSYDYATTTTVGVGKNTSNSYGLNFSKQCLMPLAKNFYFTVGGGVTGLYVDNKNTYNQTNAYETDKSGQFSVGLQPGVSYKLTKKLLFDLYVPNIFSVNYATGTHHYYATNGSDTKTTNNSFNLATNLNSNLWNNLTFGIRFLLNSKKS